jgi:hypothetical protein
MKPLIYLGSPYWHESELIRLARATQTRQAVARFMLEGHLIYSPIAHNDGVHRYLPEDLRHSHEFWMSVDLPMLARCDELWVLQLAGWEDSRGLKREIEDMTKWKKKIQYV